MGKAEQLRFYAVSEFFNDDERLMAHAIPKFLQMNVSPEEIYHDLLSCKLKRWIDCLEQVTESTTMTALSEWCNQMEFNLDMSRDSLWAKGDFTTLSESAWKIGIGAEE